MEIIMLNIDSLQNGVVIDHIPAGQGLDIYRLLNLDAQSHSVALLQYVKSEKYGCKDLIKIEGTFRCQTANKSGVSDKSCSGRSRSHSGSNSESHPSADPCRPVHRQ